MPHKNKVMQYLYFYVWLISLRIVSSMFIHIVASGQISSSFSKLNNIPPFLIHLSINEPLGCLWVLDSMSQLQWTWEGSYLFEIQISFLLDAHWGVGLPDHMVALSVIFEDPHVVFHSGCTGLHSLPQQYTRFQFSSHPCQHLLSCLFDNCHSSKFRWYFMVVLIGILFFVFFFLVISDVEQLFMSLAICVSSFEKCLFGSFTHFKIFVCLFVCLFMAVEL